ncbi:GAF domain-containing protein [Actinocatenispora rupis]|uniref:GAF domain-containing protein n=1 Tax=Actinocatenispora rupis TaxID=519421 RepID=A0A8J3NEP5_9ACTN|nr:GAF domain-containing protein [Actinocatenispora rupis]GID14135.1 hypothetical protein Aru02nite_50240 [Actinocatenispora rupis]
MPETDEGGRERFPRWARYGLIVVLPVATVVTTAAASVTAGPVRVYWILGTVAVTLIAGYLNVSEARKAERMRVTAVQARAELGESLSRAGQPLLEVLGRVVGTKAQVERKRHLEVLVTKSVELAASQCGRKETGCRTRSVFYTLSRDGTELANPLKSGWLGNSPRDRYTSTAGEAEREMVMLAQGERARLIGDVRRDSSDCLYPGQQHRSFLAVPVRANGKSHGLLMVDSDVPDSLTEVDLGYLILIANALAAGLARDET